MRNTPSYAFASIFAVSASWLAIRVGPMPMSDVFLIGAVLIDQLVVRVRCSSSPKRLHQRFRMSLSLTMLVLAIVVIRSIAMPSEGLGAMANELWSAGAMLVLVPFLMIRQSDQVNRLAKWFIVGVLVSTAVACFEVVSGLRVVDISGSQGVFRGRVSGLTGHPNQLGLSIVLALAVWNHLAGRDSYVFSKLEKYRWPALSILIVGLGLSASRSAALAAGCLGMLQLVQLARDPRRSAARSAVAGLVVLATTLAVFPRAGVPLAGRLVGNSETASSDDLRRGQLEHGIELFWESAVFGSGAEAAGSIHNFFLNVLVSWGVVGSFAFLGAIFLMLGSGKSSRVFANRSLLVWMAFGLAQNAVTDRYIFLACITATILDQSVEWPTGEAVRARSNYSSSESNRRTDEGDKSIGKIREYGPSAGSAGPGVVYVAPREGDAEHQQSLRS